MARKSDERDGCDGESIQAEILIKPSSTGKYDRFWSRVLNVRRFIRLCKNAYILKGAGAGAGAALLSGVPLLLPRHPIRLSPPTSTVPLLQSEEQQPNEPTDHPLEGSSSSVLFRTEQSLVFKRSASSAHQYSQFAFHPKKSSTADEAPSPNSSIKSLLPSVSAETHLAIDLESDKEKEEKLEQTITRIFDEKDLNSLQELGGAENLALAFGSDLKSGKNTVFHESTFTYKKQVLAKHFPRFFIRACNRYTIFLLILSGCASLGFEMVEKSPKKGWHDGAAIFLAVFLIATTDSVSSFRQARKQEKKMLKQSRIKVSAIRNGQSETVPIYGIVKGDILRLEKDQTVPADGLLVSGDVEVDGHFGKLIDCNKNPFLFSGSMVVGGRGGTMLVTSVGSNAVSFKELLLEARIKKPNTWAEFLSLCMALLIALVLFLRFLRQKHDYNDGGSSQVKGEITVLGVLKIFERMFLKPRGTVSILASFMAAVVIGIQHGMPFVISISLAYWNEKNASNKVVPLTLAACGTMGLVTVICVDISGGLIGEEDAVETMRQHRRTMKEEAEEEEEEEEEDAIETMRQHRRTIKEAEEGASGRSEDAVETMRQHRRTIEEAEEEEEGSGRSEDAVETMRQHRRTMKEAVMTFKKAGVDIRLVSEDDGLSALTYIACELGVCSVDSTDEVFEGQEIRNLSNDELKKRADRIKVMANSLPKDKLSMVQCLKDNGHVVAFYGGSTARDALVLKAADVGISDKNSTEMAKKSSDIIISSYQSFNSLIPIYKYGRWAYYNIQKFIQLQLTVMVSSLVITSVATMALRESPITLIQLIWVNLITAILGGLMLITEPGSRELDTLQAAGKRNEPVITKAMWVYILTQILYQASVLLVFLFERQPILGINRRVKKAIIFNSFALCQVLNYGNAMDLEKKWSYGGVKRKGFLLVAVGTAVAVQVVVAEIWARLNLLQWAVCFLIAALSWGLGLTMKSLSPFTTNCLFIIISSHVWHSRWMPPRHNFCFIIFMSLFFLFCFSSIVSTEMPPGLWTS